MRTLWLTRTASGAPESEGDRLTIGLEQAGWTVEALAVLGIEHYTFSAAQLEAIRTRVRAAQWVLWTSSQALPVVKDLSPAAFAHLPPDTLYAVGARTAEVASSVLQRVVRSPDSGHGGRAWANAMQGRWKAGDRVVVFTGEGGRASWSDAAELAGVVVDCIPVYERSQKIVALPERSPDAVIVTSGAALQALSAADLGATVQRRCLLLPDARLREAARQHGWSGTMISLTDLSVATVLEGLHECC